MTRPHLALVCAGGTIDALGASRLDLAWYTETERRLPAGEIVAAVPELSQFAEIEQVPFERRPSYAFAPSDWLTLARTVNGLLARPDVDGVVITHGTNTLEETAYFLHLTTVPPKPVVLVGAMRPANGLGSEGQLNLLRAVQVAADPAARGLGALVAMNDTVHSARDVTKSHTFRPDTFRSPDAGPVGAADADGRVVFYHRPVRVPAEGALFAVDRLTELPRVDVVLSYLGADGILIDAAVAAGCKGLVSAGTGAGRPTAGEQAALDRALQAGVVVCQASRVGSGRVPRSPKMAARGIVTADNLQPWKARVLLLLALTKTFDTEAVQEMFDRL